MSNLITEIDYKRIEQIERVRSEYFKEMPTEHEFNKLNKTFLKDAFNKSKIGLIMLIALTILIGFLTQLPFFTIAILCFSFYYGYNYNKIVNEYLQNYKSCPLAKEFFLEKLKEDGLEIGGEEIKRYNVFLKRYIHYKIRNRRRDISSRARIHFGKRDANELTTEELFESAILFERDSKFLKQEYTHHIH